MVDGQTYGDLLAAAKSNPSAADFCQLRLAYAGSPHYDPFSKSARTDPELREALGSGRAERVVEVLDGLLAANYVDVQAHLFSALVYQGVGNAGRTAFHQDFGQHLLDSIMRSGDGQSYETAFVVISVAEEYTVLDFLGLDLDMQTLVEHDCHHFDVMYASQRQTQEASTVYFNIDLPHTWLCRRMEEDPEGFMKGFEAEIGQAGREVPKARK